MNQPLFTVPLNAQILVDVMKESKPGDIHTYESLAVKIGGEDPRKVWLSARRILRQDHDLIFDCIRTKGYQCLNGSQVVDKGVSTRRKIRRIVRGRNNELRTIKPQDLPPEERVKYHAEVAVTALIHASVSDEIRRQALEGKVLSVGAGRTAADLAALFNKPAA